MSGAACAAAIDDARMAGHSGPVSDNRPDILCIGSVLWDVIGRSPTPVAAGADIPGQITRLPGGVAMNIAMTLRRFGLTPALLSAIGHDAEGDELLEACGALGLVTTHVHRDARLPTDRYMAIEGAGGLVAAIADARSLEAAGEAILAPLEDGRLGDATRPYDGIVALEGNLTEALLGDIATRASFRAADLRLAPASPGKATRLAPLMDHPGVTLYVNREEAGLLTGTTPASAAEGARALCAAGVTRALVTDGAAPAAEAQGGEVTIADARQVAARRVTGAGDTFMAAHIAAERRGATRTEALAAAQAAAARYVAGEDP